MELDRLLVLFVLIWQKSMVLKWKPRGGIRMTLVLMCSCSSRDRMNFKYKADIMFLLNFGLFLSKEFVGESLWAFLVSKEINLSCFGHNPMCVCFKYLLIKYSQET